MSQIPYEKGLDVAVISGRYARKTGFITRLNSKMSGFYWVMLKGLQSELSFGHNQLIPAEQLNAPAPVPAQLAIPEITPEVAVLATPEHRQPSPELAASSGYATAASTGTRSILPKSASLDPENFRWKRYQYSSLPAHAQQTIIEVYKQELQNLSPDQKFQFDDQQWVTTFRLLDPLLETDDRARAIRMITGWDHLQQIIAESAGTQEVPYLSQSVAFG